MTQKPKNLPAIILDMPNEEYHRGEWSRDFVSSTQLKNLLISPKAFDYLRRIGGVEISLEASMKGSVYHAIWPRLPTPDASTSLSLNILYSSLLLTRRQARPTGFPRRSIKLPINRLSPNIPVWKLQVKRK